MEACEEIKNFIKIWFLAISSICYVYLISVRISPGIPRLLSILPVLFFFLILPLPVSTTHLAVPTFLYLTWLANFKLLLFAINRGPFASTPLLPFLVFISVTLFPINPKKSHNKVPNPAPLPSTDTTTSTTTVPSHKPIMLAFKAFMFSVITRAYRYKNLNENVIQVLNLCYTGLSIELTYAITACFVKLFLGFSFEIERQFNEPLLATSLQDFWGRRWNLMATGILRPTVYNPTQEILTPILGRFKSRLLAIFVTFVVSGLMHELLYLYLTRVPPTWEVTWYFVIHGLCTAIEVAVKKAAKNKFRLHRAVSGPLTIAFMVVTSVWLLLSQLMRNGVDVKIRDEYSLLVNLLGVERNVITKI